MSYKPPFTITTEILNLVAHISQQAGRLDASILNASPQLRKQNRIRTITGTLAIESNTLTEKQLAQSMAQNAPVKQENVSGLKTSEAIVALLAAKPERTRQQLGDAMGKDIRTIGCALAKLQQAGKIKRVGSDKTGHWEVQP